MPKLYFHGNFLSTIRDDLEFIYQNSALSTWIASVLVGQHFALKNVWLLNNSVPADAPPE